MGPLINAAQRDRVLSYVEKGKAEGARLVVGGGKPEQLPKGYYVEPTLFADVDNKMTIARIRFASHRACSADEVRRGGPPFAACSYQTRRPSTRGHDLSLTHD